MSERPELPKKSADVLNIEDFLPKLRPKPKKIENPAIAHLEDEFVLQSDSVKNLHSQPYAIALQIERDLGAKKLDAGLLFAHRGIADSLDLLKLDQALERYMKDPSVFQETEALAIAERALREYRYLYEKD